MQMFDINAIPSQKGRVVIVTGANSGLGFEITKTLAGKGATVVMACRNERKAWNAKQVVVDSVPDADLHLIPLDLARLSSVRAFADAFHAKFHRLDLLINNAGVMMPPLTQTEDGLDLQTASNYFGHFLLTGLLLDVAIKTAGARIVQVSSIAHRLAKTNFEFMPFGNRQASWQIYAQSKLACLMFAYELDRRLKTANYQLLSVAAHPGFSNTNIFRHMPKLFMRLLGPFLKLFMQTSYAGSLPILMAALGDQALGGDYYGSTQCYEIKGPPGRVTSAAIANDPESAAKLWQIAEETTGVQFLAEFQKHHDEWL